MFSIAIALQAKLLFAKYNDEKLNLDVKSNLDNYQQVVVVWHRWEKSFVALAQYNESVYEMINIEDRDVQGRWRIILQSIRLYAIVIFQFFICTQGLSGRNDNELRKIAEVWLQVHPRVHAEDADGLF